VIFEATAAPDAMLSERHLLSYVDSAVPLFINGGRLSLLLADVFPVFLLAISIVVSLSNSVYHV